MGLKHYRDLIISTFDKIEEALKSGNLDKAKEYALYAIDVSSSIRDVYGLALSRCLLAMISMLSASKVEDFLRAISDKVMGWNLNDALKIFEYMNDKYNEAEARRLLSIMYMICNDFGKAIEEARRALNASLQIDDETIQASCKTTLACILMLSSIEDYSENLNLNTEVTRLLNEARRVYRRLRDEKSIISSIIWNIHANFMRIMERAHILQEMSRAKTMLDSIGNRLASNLVLDLIRVFEKDEVSRSDLTCKMGKILLIV